VGRPQLARLGAPAVFLLAITIVVLLVRSGLNGGPSVGGTGTLGHIPSTSAPTTVVPTRSSTAGGGGSAPGRYYTVQKGDTFGAIAAREGTTIAKLEALNPTVKPTTLQVGQKIRIR
jgi:LysM repeat protein